jgi:Cu+-exporting ATPase
VDEFWINKYRNFFRTLIFFLSLPSFLYSASGYYISAYKSIKSKMLNIDIPIAIGIIVMFVRSVIDITFDYGQGFFDSLTGLVFFMLLGKLFQQKTYDFLSFERDFKSYFPIAVTKINQNGEEEPCQIYDVEKGDRLIIRNQELIPVDGILISPKTALDYSFVTGEAIPIEKKSGDKVFAGGKQMGGIIEMEVLFSVSQSYLTQLWSNDVFQKKIDQKHKSITDKVSQYFTPALLILAFGSLIFWLFINAYLAFNVFTAVLIVACPCALALTAPFTLGNVLRIMGNHKLYLKNAQVIEQMAKVDTIVFDKTGTITSSLKSNIEYTGTDLSNKELANIKSIVRNSNHPLSRKLYAFLPQSEIVAINSYEEIVGKGMLASVENVSYKIGSLYLMNLELEIEKDKNTKVHIEIDSEYKGYFAFNHQYREGLNTLFNQLDKNNFKTVVLSGDNNGEQEYLQSVLPQNTTLVFHQKPEQKLEYIQKLQNEGKNVMMVGDGLNDAGALAQSNIGIALSENVNVFSPACDGIMDASQFQKLFHYIQYSKNAMKTIYMSFGLSLLYNSVGLTFALSGKLSPLFAAIIMPMSAITIVSFVTILSKFYGKNIKS